MDCMSNCLTATSDTMGACLTGIGSGLGAASNCISSNCSTFGTSVANGCSALGRGLSDCFGSFTTTASNFVTGPLWSCMQSIWSAVSNFFNSGFTWLRQNPIRVMDISIGCALGVTITALSVFFFSKYSKSEDTLDGTNASPIAEAQEGNARAQTPQTLTLPSQVAQSQGTDSQGTQLSGTESENSQLLGAVSENSAESNNE